MAKRLIRHPSSETIKRWIRRADSAEDLKSTLDSMLARLEAVEDMVDPPPGERNETADAPSDRIPTETGEPDDERLKRVIADTNNGTRPPTTSDWRWMVSRLRSVLKFEPRPAIYTDCHGDEHHVHVVACLDPDTYVIEINQDVHGCLVACDGEGREWWDGSALVVHESNLEEIDDAEEA